MGAGDDRSKLKKWIPITILIAALVFVSTGEVRSVFAQQYSNYEDPGGKWSIQYPSGWLVGHNATLVINGTNIGQNISKFVPFESQYSNVSISIGITSRIGNQSYATLFHQSEGNCDAYLLAGKKACVRVFLENIHGVTVTATINGVDYLFDFKGGTQPEFEYSLPIFMQMLTTFKPK